MLVPGESPYLGDAATAPQTLLRVTERHRVTFMKEFHNKTMPGKEKKKAPQPQSASSALVWSGQVWLVLGFVGAIPDWLHTKPTLARDLLPVACVWVHVFQNKWLLYLVLPGLLGPLRHTERCML